MPFVWHHFTLVLLHIRTSPTTPSPPALLLLMTHHEETRLDTNCSPHPNPEGGTKVRSSRPEVFCKKLVLRNFTKFTGKHLYQSLFFNKVVSLRPATLLKKKLWHRCFPVNVAKFLRKPFLQNTSGRLLLLLVTM